METKIYIDYEMIFADKPLAIFDYLKNIDRHNLICVAIRLIYSDDLFSDFKDYCAEFFCAENFNFANECYHLLNERIQEDNKDTTSIIPRKYIITSQTAALELLRQTFAINIGDFVSNTPQVLQEQYLFKAILLINKLIGHWEAPLEYDSKGAITNLCLAKSILCTTLNDFDSSNLKAEYIAMLQIIKGYHFFRYCEHSKLREHLSIFLENNGAKSWQHYLYDAIQLILFPLQNKHGNFPRIILNNQRYGEKFLRVHSFQEDTIVSLENNMDYTYFKSHPLIELNDGTYLPISPLFCINHIYKSIYFEFKAINESFVGTSTYLKGQGLLSIFTTEFSEQTLFEYYTRNALYRHNGLKLSDKDCKLIIDVGHEPDFYCRDGNNIMLFENKDIKIPDKVISSKQYDLLESELHKKLITNKGVSQLIYNIKQIERNTFKWDSSIPNNPRIYPILVIDDSSLCAPGLNYILNEEFQQQLKNNNIKIKVYPLILIELDTLIAFANYFQLRDVRLKKILEQYYKYISRNKRPQKIEQIIKEVLHKYFPFYIFMSKEIVKTPFDNTMFKKVCDELRKAIETQQ